jgi:hypothetical protein
MGYTSFITGVNTSIRLIDNIDGSVYNFDDTGKGLGGNLTDFSSDPVVETLRDEPISNGGEQIVQDEHRGWKGEFTVTRSDSGGEDFQVLIETFYANTGLTRKFTIIETTLNTDSTVTRWQYTNCAVRMTARGTSKIGSKVEQKFTFDGGRRYAA